MSSCECCHTQPQSTNDKFPFSFDTRSTPNSLCCQPCETPKTTILEKLPPKDRNSTGGFSFDTETPVIHPIQLTWKQHVIDEVKVPYPSQWQYLENNPKKLTWVGLPKIQLGLVDLDIPNFPERNPTQTPSNLEIDQIIQASLLYPKVAETFAFINLVHPTPVGNVLWKTKIVRV